MFGAFVEKDVCKNKKNEDFLKFIQKYSLVLCMGVEWVKKPITNLTGLFKTIIKEKNKMLCRKK